MILNNYLNHANIVIQWFLHLSVDKDLLIDATNNFRADQLWSLDWNDRYEVLDQMPKNLWWYIKEKRWKRSSSDFLIDLLDWDRDHMPSAMESSIYRELINRKPNLDEEDINRLSERLKKEMQRFTTQLYYSIGGKGSMFDVGLKGRTWNNTVDDLRCGVDDFVYHAFAHFPNFEFIDSLVYSTYDNYNWHDNETKCNWRAHEVLIFIAKVSKECRDKITGSLRKICDKNESAWRNSTFFDDHSGSFKAMRLIEYEITEIIEDKPEGMEQFLNWIEVNNRIDIAIQEHQAL